MPLTIKQSKNGLKQREHKKMRKILPLIVFVIYSHFFIPITYTHAITQNNRAKTIVDSLVDSLKSRARDFKQNGRYEEAISCWKQVLRLDPNDRETPLELGLTYYESGPRTDQNAIESLRLGLAKNQNSVAGYYALGSIYFRKAMYTEALTQFREVINLDSTHYGSHYKLGYIYYDNGNHDLTFKEFLSGSRLRKKISLTQWDYDPLLITPYFVSCEMFLNRNMFDEAEFDARAILRIEPENQKALNLIDKLNTEKDKCQRINENLQIAESLFNSGNFREAEPRYRTVRDLEPNNTEAKNKLFIIYMKLGEKSANSGNWNNAIKNYKNACDFASGDEQKKEAQNAYNAAIEKRAYHAQIDTLISRGDRLEENKEWEKARENFSTVVFLDPKNKDAREKLEKVDVSLAFKMGALAKEKKAWSLAIWFFQKVPKNDPDYAKAQDEILEVNRLEKLSILYPGARTAYNNKEWRSAKSQYEEILKIDKENQEAKERTPKIKNAIIKKKIYDKIKITSEIGGLFFIFLLLLKVYRKFFKNILSKIKQKKKYIFALLFPMAFIVSMCLDFAGFINIFPPIQSFTDILKFGFFFILFLIPPLALLPKKRNVRFKINATRINFVINKIDAELKQISLLEWPIVGKQVELNNITELSCSAKKVVERGKTSPSIDGDVLFKPLSNLEHFDCTISVNEGRIVMHQLSTLNNMNMILEKINNSISIEMALKKVISEAKLIPFIQNKLEVSGKYEILVEPCIIENLNLPKRHDIIDYPKSFTIIPNNRTISFINNIIRSKVTVKALEKRSVNQTNPPIKFKNLDIHNLNFMRYPQKREEILFESSLKHGTILFSRDKKEDINEGDYFLTDPGIFKNLIINITETDFLAEYQSKLKSLIIKNDKDPQYEQELIQSILYLKDKGGDILYWLSIVVSIITIYQMLKGR